ncbi:MAG: bifunctional 2-polyprenyl-6-hydroxyphenol methylase/3-demethylubiquinol 3-O-methyltransferase UbiG [Sphingomonas sp.]
MANASAPANDIATRIGSSIDGAEAAHFGRLAADWWDPKGSSAMLHRLNPARLGYLRAAANAHWMLDSASFAPLAGKSALDVGCGAGLLCEPVARLGARVTGLDAAPENIAAARAHAAKSGLAIDYRAGSVEDLKGERFDLVTCLEVVEHVVDPVPFIAGLARALADGGLMVLSTPNRTMLSRVALISIGEGLGQIPRGTHDWDKFLTPDELTALVQAAGLTVTDTRGLRFSPARGFEMSDDLRMNYFITATTA